MAEAGRGKGAGRGAALLAMFKNVSEVGEPKSDPVPESTLEPLPAERPLGRARLLSMVQRSQMVDPGQPSSPTRSPTSSQVGAPVPAPRMGGGRGSMLMGMVQKVGPAGGASHSSPVAPPVPAERVESPPATVQKPPAKPVASGDGQGVVGSLAAMNLEPSYSTSGSSGPISRMGQDGSTINLKSNYIDIMITPDKGIFRYDVKFDPETDSPKLRNALLNQHLEYLGGTKVFDGTVLYIPKKLENDRVELMATRLDGTKIKIILTFQFQQKPKESIQFYNVLLNRLLSMLKLVRINRNYYNARAAHAVHEHRMELWPGYVTAIEEMEGGLKLNIDASHRLMHTSTIRDLIKDVLDKSRGGNFKDAVFRELSGMTVLTRYNNQTYRVDDIHWDKNPSFLFDYKGSKISIADYFKAHWNLVIRDLEQPLILHRAKKKLTQGGTKEEEILLVPELCYLTGMSEAVRSNFRIMRDLAKVTQVVPDMRRQTILKFIEDVNKTPATKKLLDDWGLRFEDDIVQLRGRVLPEEMLFFGGDKSAKVNDRADWSAIATKTPVLRTPHMKNWCIVYIQRDEWVINEFVKMLFQVCRTIAMNVGEPLKIPLRNDSAQSYIAEIRKAINPNLEMVVAVCPTNRNDRYAAIKKLCCVESPIKSQVIVTKTISQENKIKSVTEKIALQMNCKLGGALWALKAPFSDVMLIGIDVYHAPAGSGPSGSVVGFVASTDKTFTSWYSRVCFQSPGQEIIDLLKICFVSAITAYKKKRGEYPARIIIYRDGVGDGQLPYVAQYEVNQFKSAYPLIEATYSPKLTVIVVQKRVNTRLMAMRGASLTNPPPGTVADSSITRRNWYDFYLVPQTARQGTVTPTHYVVLIDEYNHKTDHLQRLSYKLCHLYYNWPGTIRVPAPCQYAHKIANLVGQSVRAEPNDCLADSLYYL